MHTGTRSFADLSTICFLQNHVEFSNTCTVDLSFPLISTLPSYDNVITKHEHH